MNNKILKKLLMFAMFFLLIIIGICNTGFLSNRLTNSFLLSYKSLLLANTNYIEVSNWNELYEAVSVDKYEKILLKSGGIYNADKLISIENGQNVTLIPEDDKGITVKRSDNYKGNLIVSDGNLVLGSSNMTGTILIDGNKDNVTDAISLININSGSLISYKNVILCNNQSKGYGGALFVNKANVKINGSVLRNNIGTYGGGIFVQDDNSILETNGANINSNEALSGSGGAIYARGTLKINGNTSISDNIASTFGGGIMIKSYAVINDGVISGNTASNNAGGGIRVDGELILNGGVVTNNSAHTTGGGIDFSPGFLTINGGTVENNTALEDDNNLYPNINSPSNVDWSKNSDLKLQSIDVTLLKSFIKGQDYNAGGLQGFTLTNKYIIAAFWTDNNDNTSIKILDKNTLKLLNTVDNYNFAHANDFAYNSKTDEIYVLTSSKRIAKFKVNSSYEIVNLEYVDCERVYSALAYDMDNDRFVGFISNNIYILNNKFKELSSFSVINTLTSQGMSYFDNHIYFSSWEAGYPTKIQSIYNAKEKGSNLIYVYDMQGNLDKTLYIPNKTLRGEIESVSFYDNKELLLGYNTSLSNKATISFFKSTDLVKLNDFSIKLKKVPQKKQYIKNLDQLDLTGGILEIIYSDGTTKELSLTNKDIEVTGFNNSKLGKNTLTVKYENKTTTFDVEIVNENEGYRSGNGVNNKITVPNTGSVIALSGIIFGFSLIVSGSYVLYRKYKYAKK